MVAYIAGLATTMGVMHFFNAAQPALLYLSPACILSSLITAAVRGEIKDLFAYTTEEEEEEKKKKKDLVEEKEITIDEKRTIVTESIETETIELEQIDGGDEEEDEEEAETTGRSKGSQAKKRRNKKK